VSRVGPYLTLYVRLTCVISSLAVGGAERVLTTLANAWARAGSKVTILTFDDGRAPSFFPVDERVAHSSLDLLADSPNLVSAVVANARRIFAVRRAVRRAAPDVVVSFMDATNVLTLLATRGLGVPVVVSERINMALYSSGRAWRKLRSITYPWADRIVVQTDAALRQLPSHWQRRAVAIPNPVLPPAASITRSDSASTARRIIAVGRLDDQKGFDRLLGAFERVARRHAGWTLQIWGDGPARHRLLGMRSELGLETRVEFAGTTTDIYGALREADLFVLPSRFEGFPNVLCEAMAAGLPVVACDCPYGPREIVRDGVDGVLVKPDDIERLADAVSRLIENEAERQRLAARAPEVVHRFGLERVLRDWNVVFAAIDRRGRARTGGVHASHA
jgi:glycosyltransferase involved in cell wall biosynthesis